MLSALGFLIIVPFVAHSHFIFLIALFNSINFKFIVFHYVYVSLRIIKIIQLFNLWTQKYRKPFNRFLIEVTRIIL
jgi:hypothetical protein